MSTEDEEARVDELFALASIYSEDEFVREDEVSGGKIHLCLELPSNFVISIKSNSATNSSADNFEDIVSFLPPIVLNFDLPPGYPSTTPPNFTLSCKWLSPAQLTLLCQRLDDLWEENKGSVVLFRWIQFLNEETLDYLNIKSPYEIEVSGNGVQDWLQSPDESLTDGVLLERGALDRRAIQDAQSVPALVQCILDVNEAQQKKDFDRKQFLCNICFMEKSGSECTDFKACQHVYCNYCLKDYFEIQIKDGQVHALNCPEPECTSVATHAQVKDLVEEQLFSRYDHLLLRSSLDLMTDIVYCPRPSCRTPVMQEPDKTMGICTACKYAFCLYCKTAFHGLSPCMVSAERLVELTKEYFAANAKTKREMLKRYAQLGKAVEDAKNKEWIQENSKPCPSCKSPIQKIDGCNKMTCTACKQYFCWICLMILSQEDPYKHFGSGLRCINR
ncbi:E3 ubiquitin-protein ligase RNF14-like [Dendropsophus ebraccatus]|uniref:E3 ubiquitin-protein ligase RNF14-like n=1 Tax=Dendropsophus ebraccatus TaxID=150705 RepID=UPI0038317243